MGKLSHTLLSLTSMASQQPMYCTAVSQEDWESTSASVKRLIKDMAQRLNQLEQQLTPVAGSRTKSY